MKFASLKREGPADNDQDHALNGEWNAAIDACEALAKPKPGGPVAVEDIDDYCDMKKAFPDLQYSDIDMWRKVSGANARALLNEIRELDRSIRRTDMGSNEFREAVRKLLA